MNRWSATTCDISNRWPSHVKYIHCSICCHHIEVGAQQLQLDAKLLFVEIRVIHVANDVQMEDPRHNALLADLD